MGQDGRGMGEKEDPRMRQQQNPLASPTVRHFIIVSAPSNALALSFSFFLYLSRSSPSPSFFVRFATPRDAQLLLTFTSILTAPFVYMRTRALSRAGYLTTLQFHLFRENQVPSA